jgi:multisubunit Na+/H+ antiporter MnhB subunit
MLEIDQVVHGSPEVGFTAFTASAVGTVLAASK